MEWQFGLMGIFKYRILVRLEPWRYVLLYVAALIHGGTVESWDV